MNIRVCTIGIALAALVGPLGAQEKKEDDPFGRALFAPELVLKHATEIGLKPDQRQTIVNTIKKVQGDLVGLQLDMTEPAQELVALLQEAQVDEAQALAKVERVLAIERDVKKMQLSLLIRIKNVLTKDQQEQLKRLRSRDEAQKGGAGGADGALGTSSQMEASNATH